MNQVRWERLRECLRTWSWKEGDFTLASGARSPYYVDVRRTSLTPEGGTLIGELLLERMKAEFPEAVAAGGLTLGADPLATAVALASWRAGAGVTSYLVRKEPKGHGAGSQIEPAGDLAPGSKVVVLDDTVTSGGSTLKAVAALREAGYEVVGALAVVDRLEGARERLSEAGLRLVSLYTVNDLRAGAA